jgi:hypothetical protein
MPRILQQGDAAGQFDPYRSPHEATAGFETLQKKGAALGEASGSCGSRLVRFLDRCGRFC